MHDPITLIVNDAAGSADDERVEAARAVLGERGPVHVVAAPGPGLTAAARDAARRGHLVVAGGGDGTVNAVATGVREAGGVLGVLPLGTLNHFAKALGLPDDPAEAARALLQGRERLVDVGEVNGRVFLNNASLGVYPRAVRERDRLRDRRGWRKWPAMALATGRQLMRLQGHRLDVCVDGDGHPVHTPGLLVSNNCYSMTGLTPGSRESLDAGELGLYLLRGVDRRSAWRVLGRAATGGLLRDPALMTRRARTVEVRARDGRALPLAVDGEPVPSARELSLSVHPASLRVLAPA
jgi:diacylglycerol kinase family enzyme